MSQSAAATHAQARYVVVTRCAPATGGAGRFRRPVHVRVMDTTRSEWHAVRGLNDGVKLEVRNVDSRYAGPRSEYGRAVCKAQELAAALNALSAVGQQGGAN